MEEQRSIEWKPVRHFDGLYEVSNTGEVVRLLKSGKRKPLKRKYHKYRMDRPYHTFSNKRENVTKDVGLGQLVYTHFTPDWNFDKNPRSYFVYKKDTRKDYEYNNLLMIDRKTKENPMKSKADHFVKHMPYVYYVYDADKDIPGHSVPGCRYIKFSKTMEYELKTKKYRFDESGYHKDLKQRTLDFIIARYKEWLIINHIMEKDVVHDMIGKFERKY